MYYVWPNGDVLYDDNSLEFEGMLNSHSDDYILIDTNEEDWEEKVREKMGPLIGLEGDRLVFMENHNIDSVIAQIKEMLGESIDEFNSEYDEPMSQDEYYEGVEAGREE
jgi:hypothetical protein